MPTVPEFFSFLSDDFSTNVLQFLEFHKGVTNVKFHERTAVSMNAMSTWEKMHYPYLLPEDYKRFASISDGLLLRWDFLFQDDTLPLGCMHLNELVNVKPVELDSQIDRFAFDEASFPPELATKLTERKLWRAFDLDHKCPNGQVALIYNCGYNNPQVWFKDLGCGWNFIASSFTDYFRLLITHLGLPNWQYAFCPMGIDPVSKQWFRFLAPERFAIDMEHHRAKGKKRPQHGNAVTHTQRGGRRQVRLGQHRQAFKASKSKSQEAGQGTE